MLSWANFGSQLFNGLALGALLALIASGLTIIYGTLGVLNLAHGAMFMLGGYAGYAAYQATGSFVAAVAAGTLALGVLGIVMERVVIRWFYARPRQGELFFDEGKPRGWPYRRMLRACSRLLHPEAPSENH